MKHVCFGGETTDPDGSETPGGTEPEPTPDPTPDPTPGGGNYDDSDGELAG